MLSLVGLLVGVTVALRVDAPPDDRSVLELGLRVALEDRGHQAQLLKPGACASAACTASSVGAEELWLVNAIPAVSTVRLFVEVERDGARLERELSLGVDRTAWAGELSVLVEALLGRAAPVVAEAPSPSLISPRGLLRGGLLVGGGALVATAVGLFVSASASESSLTRALDSRDSQGLVIGINYYRAEDELSSINLRRNLSLGLGLAGAAALVGTVIWILVPSEEPSSVALHPSGSGWAVRF